MTKYTGKTATSGIAIGKAYNFKISQNYVRRHHIDDTDAEILRLEEAIISVKNTLKETYIKASSETDKNNASIFEVYQLILDDADIKDSIIEIIVKRHVNAEFAVTVVYRKVVKKIKNSKDSYQSERIDDVKDVYKQIISSLNKNEVAKSELSSLANNITPGDSVIIFADELTPSEIINIDKSNVTGFVISKGSLNSHATIILKSMGFPVIIGVKYQDSMENKFCIVDADTGELIVGPDNDFISQYEKMQNKIELENKEFLKVINKETLTKDGKRIYLYANVVDDNDLSKINDYNADGVGLFRSEFLYLKNENYPSEDELFIAFKKAAETLGNKRLIIRTLDIGPDKIPEYFIKDKNINYSESMRGVEFCLNNIDLFKTELRAIIRASAYGNVAIMYPMVNTSGTFIQIKEIVNQVISELNNENITIGSFIQGAMIETKEAVKNSDAISKEADFISIGSNDLSDDLFNPNHDRNNTSVFTKDNYSELLDNIKIIIDNGHKNNIKVEICGELASNINFTEQLLKMDIDGLSVVPLEVLRVREKILSI